MSSGGICSAQPKGARTPLVARIKPSSARPLKRDMLAGESARAFPQESGGNDSLLALKLRFDGRLVYDRPYAPNFVRAKFIEYVLCKRNSLPIYSKPKEFSLWRAVKA